MSAEQVIDRSADQKQERVKKLSRELLDMGYSVVKSDWLEAVMMQNKRKTLAGVQ
jgi:hypothetical protein